MPSDSEQTSPDLSHKGILNAFKLNQTQTRTSVITMENDDVKLRTLKNRRDRVHNTLESLHALAEVSKTDPTCRDLFKSKCSRISKNILGEYENLLEEINAIEIQLDPETSDQKLTEIWAPFEERYYQIMEIYDKFSLPEPQNQALNQQTSIVAQMHSRENLPQIELKKFDGTLSKWPEFKANFQSLIHKNETLSLAAKFHYLWSSLSGPPLALVKELPLTDENYIIAWNSLTERYENKRMIGVDLLNKLLTFQSIKNENKSDLTNFLSTFGECSSALKSIQIPDLADFMLLQLGLKVLPVGMHKAFERLQKRDIIPTYSDLLHFVQQQIQVLELTSSKVQSKENPADKIRIGNTGKKPNFAFTKQTLTSVRSENSQIRHTQSERHCVCCHQNHSLYSCEQFLKKPIKERRLFVNTHNLCFNCLAGGHSVINCKSPYSCRECKKRHNTHLHLNDVQPNNRKPVTTQSSSNSSNDQTQPVKALISNSKPQEYNCILGTAVVLVENKDGIFQPVRSLIDSAAMSTFITKKCAQRLGLEVNVTEPENTPGIAGLGNQALPTQNIEGTVHCVIKSRFDSHPIFPSTATVIDSITSDLPNMRLPDAMRRPLRNLKLADPDFLKPAQIDLLIGADLFPHIYDGRKIILSENWPVALSSIYGWVLTGKYIPTCTKTTKRPITALLSTNAEPTDTILKRFWEIEEPPIKLVKNPDDELAEQMFMENHSRTSDGQYKVPMLLTGKKYEIGESYSLAQNRLVKLENRLNKNPEFKAAYQTFMKEYEDLGHMQVVSLEAEKQGKYYIPHHGIWRPDKASSKMRTVFDASMKTTSGISLNEALLSGEKLQLDITQILISFRFPRFVMTADIRKMYRMILINDEERPYQRILWRNESTEPIKEYELHTVTYGERSSPFLALRTMIQLVNDEGDNHPKAAQILKRNIFVDDILFGCNTIPEAKEERDDLIALLLKGCFHLAKYASNSPDLICDIPESCRQTSVNFSETEDTISTLGLLWQPANDHFSYKISDVTPTCTKRGVLSLIARIFDPLGLISPVVFAAKQLMQQIWLLGIGWDDPIPSPIQQQWDEFSSNLKNISNLKIPRHVSMLNANRYDLIGFSDASKLGYSAVVFIRTEDITGQVKTNLLMAKTKVSPLKPLSIPRLELSGAALLATLLKTVDKFCAHDVTITSIFAFTDATIVLDWIRTPPYKLKVFEANRVTKILETLTPQQWAHVKTDENPADIASRGCTPDALIKNPLWWHGPKWISEPIENWPKDQKSIPKTQEGLKEPKQEKIALIQTTEVTTWNQHFLESHSTLLRLIRVTAWIFRFIHNCRTKKQDRRLSHLCPSEFKAARSYWIKFTQDTAFKSELKLIKSKETPKNLLSLSPFIDKEGYLRVGGRLRHSELRFDSKYPILLPKKHHLSELLIDSSHKETLHGGPRVTLAHLNSKFWIINARHVVRAKLLKCITCFRVKPLNFQPPMGDLPKWRVQQARAFLHTGCDFGGPFTIRENKLRNSRQTKAYLALFICMATKAVHLECVSELTTQAFISSLERFVSRRGLCTKMFSDNGTNFVGSNNELKEIYKFLREDSANRKISEFLTNKEIEWHFNPPSAPNFGGLWEAGIKSAKHHIKRVMGTQIFTFEEFTTLLARIEAILNSRPLCPASTEPSELEALTPAHFLIGDRLDAVPEYSLIDAKLNHLDRWQVIQQASQSFWKTWHNEYINSLRQRSKWIKPAETLTVGDLVLIQDSNLPPQQWRMGRIINVFPGLDKILRVADVKTTTGTLRRPISKLCRLPLPANLQ